MVAQVDRLFLAARLWKLWPRMLAYALFEGRPLTTRGRWINPIVFAGHRLWSILPLRSLERPPVFVLGIGRSGTTVLGTILALHKDVGYLNEPKALWHAALGDDDLIGSYAPSPGRYRMTETDANADKVKRLHRSYRAFQALSFSRRVVDKYPELIFRNGLLDAAFPGAGKIVLLRDGYEAIQSIDEWSQLHEQDRTDWWGLDHRKWHSLLTDIVDQDPYFDPVREAIHALDRHVDMAAVEWIVTMREIQRLLSCSRDRFLVVRYEDLAEFPRETLLRICDHCGLGRDEVMLRHGEAIMGPRPPRPRPDLNPALRPLFEETMADIGYAWAA